MPSDVHATAHLTDDAQNDTDTQSGDSNNEAQKSDISRIENLEENTAELYHDIQILMDRVAKLEAERSHEQSVTAHDGIALGREDALE
jgi:hypothetical protein